MKKRNILLILLLACLVLPAEAQRRRNNHKKTAKPKTEVKKEDNKLFNNMLSSTAKVMFIDSVVVDKQDFLAHIPLNKESGKVFTKVDEQSGNIVNGYLNEFANRSYISTGDSITGRTLYTQDLIGNQWSRPMIVDGITDEYTDQDYPFLMADGITLFFAAKGEKSVGGYDIFTTTYDSENSRFYEPQNYGLPFNSTANDYFLAIDDIDSLGWLVSDRNQPEGKVCIYTFEQTSLRKDFSADDITEKELKGYAKLNAIKDTWAFGNREAAMNRLDNMLARATQQGNPNRITFIVNDENTYYNIDDFRSAENREKFLEMKGLQASLAKRMDDMTQQRLNYSEASGNVKAGMKQAMLRSEAEIESLRAQVHQMEKQIRNSEIKLLTK